ncbi:MAG: recombinase family protein [Bryobacteraceae bacterium]|nr:recombinase family protein [Bryobacteraceae bacterium]
MRAVAYSRVSSKEQSEEGYSLQAQLRVLREYAAGKGMQIVEEFVDVETARKSGREQFGRMVAYLRQHRRTCTTILVEKTDRLLRNIKDWVTLDDLGAHLHFVKEGSVISPDSRSSDKLMHGLKVVLAKNYIDLLGEETYKGMQQKALGGVYPSFAPFGYQNVQGPEGKRIIVPHPREAPIVTDLYHAFATGNYSLQSLVREARSRGIQLRGRTVYRSTLHQLLRKRIYCGDFDWDGVTYPGTHEPLTSKETWNAVQRILDQRKQHQVKSVRRDFPFSGLLRCGHCGLAMVAERKKGRYVYYHCTGHRGKCPEPYTRQERLVDEFAIILSALVIPDEVLDWLAEAVCSAEGTRAAATAATHKRLAAEEQRLKRRLATLYEDRLEERISTALYDEKAQSFHAQLATIQAQLLTTKEEDQIPLSAAVSAMRHTSNAADAFRTQTDEAQRELLTMTLKTAHWKDGQLNATLLEPFELLRRSNSANSKGINENGENGGDFEKWLLR